MLFRSVVETNKTPTAPVRGAGYPEGCFAMERVIDAVARHRGLDRAEIRRRNLVPASAIPYGTPMQARTPVAVAVGEALCTRTATVQSA